MALRVSPERVRDVRFAEQWRGYRTEEVDEFVEQVAEAFDQLEGRLEEAAQRTALAERRLDERGPDEDLRRTLVLAQRTADAALEEARVEAARMVADAEERARSILDDLEERKARLEGEIQAQVQAELAEVSERRAALEADVELLESYVEHHRGRLIEELRTQLGWLEGAGHLEPLASSPPPVLPVPTPVLAADVPTSGAPDLDDRALGRDDEAADDEAADGEADELVSESGPVEEGASDPEQGIEAVGESVASGDSHQDDTALDDLDVIPWGGPSDDGDAVTGDLTPARSEEPDDDPFIAELRRAVDDPEPLGPRDEPGEWGADVDLFDRHKADSRSRRRRRP